MKVQVLFFIVHPTVEAALAAVGTEWPQALSRQERMVERRPGYRLYKS
jgi:hypothetical protein